MTFNNKPEHFFYNPGEKDKVTHELFRQSLKSWSSYSSPTELVFVVKDISRVFPFELGDRHEDVVSYKTHSMITAHHFFLEFTFENDRTHQKTNFNIPICPLAAKTDNLHRNLMIYAIKLVANDIEIGYKDRKHNVWISSQKCFDSVQNFIPGVTGPADISYLITMEKSLYLFGIFCMTQEMVRGLVTANFLDNVYNEYCPYCPSARKNLENKISSHAEEELFRKKYFDNGEFKNYSKEMKELHDNYFRRYI
jgi:hypothetical protein